MTNTSRKKLLIIDGLNIVRRVYGANPAPDSDLKVTGCLNSSFKSIRRAFLEHTPTHAITFFDAGGPTWRHALYSDYRKSRKPMPQCLRERLGELQQQLVSGLSLRSFTVPGIEADDGIVQTGVSFLGDFPDADVVALSTDKDIAQSAAQGVKVYNHFEGVWHDDAWAQTKFGIPIELLGDYLALMGDGSDDIPGVSKIGSKTAATLLSQYGSLTAVLDAAPSIKGVVGQRLQSERSLAELSRKLVSFKLDTDLGFKWADIEVPLLPQ